MITLKFNASYCTIEGLDRSSATYQRLKTNLTYVDSKLDYQNKMSNYGKYTDPNVCLLDNKNRFYTGLLARVVWILDNCGEQYQLIKLIDNVKPSTTVELPEWLYEHQQTMITKCLEIKRGVIEAPTGSGKSVTMAWLIQHFPTEQIIITVPEKSLLKQLKDTLQQTFPLEDIGEVSGNKKEFKRVTVGIINSLSKIAQDNPDKFKTTDILICDEAHRVGANFYRQLCEACINTDYRIGFSATAWREGGDDKVLEGLLGPIMFKINEQDLIQKNILTRPVYIEVPFSSPSKKYSKYNNYTKTYNTKNNKPDRNEVYNACVIKNPARNNLIINLVIEYLKSSNPLPCLILIQNVEHGEILKELFNLRGLGDIPFVYGKTSVKERRQLVNELKSGQLKVAIASSVFNEGQDIPNLGLGIIAGGGGSESRIIQQVGRFIRKYGGKDKGIVIDIADDEEFYLKYNYQTRKQKIINTYPKALVRLTPDKLMEQASNGFKHL